MENEGYPWLATTLVFRSDSIVLDDHHVMPMIVMMVIMVVWMMHHHHISFVSDHHHFSANKRRHRKERSPENHNFHYYHITGAGRFSRYTTLVGLPYRMSSRAGPFKPNALETADLEKVKARRLRFFTDNRQPTTDNRSPALVP
jgi:hypothetical protein